MVRVEAEAGYSRQEDIAQLQVPGQDTVQVLAFVVYQAREGGRKMRRA
jgi:hypothetical protein